MHGKKIYLMRPFIGQEELSAIAEVFDSSYLTEGPVTQKFEQEFAEFVGAGHGIAVTSCAIGLELALRVYDIGKGDEVIIPSFTHPATGDCAYMVGAEPILVDVNINSYNIKPDAVREAITDKTKAIIPVSWGGNPVDPEIYKIGREYDLKIIEDSACSAGAKLDNKPVGSLADCSVFSFHPRKIITTGEGGMITTNDDEFYEKAYALKHFGAARDGKFTYHGNNYKMSNILAAIGREQLKKLPEILDDRIMKAKKYNELLSGVPGITTPFAEENVKHVYQSYCIYIEKEKNRDPLMKKLREMDIEVQIGTYALHQLPSYADTKKSGNLENSEKLANNLLTLPLHHELSEDEQKFVVRRLKEYVF